MIETPRCRQCRVSPPTLQQYACALCGYPTPAAEANGRQPEPVVPAVQAKLKWYVWHRIGRRLEHVRR